MKPTANTSVDQVFTALRLLAGGPPVGVAEVGREMNLPTSTAHRVLATAADAGFASQDTTGAKYELGVRAHMLVHGLFRQFGVQRAALPILSRLAQELGETATLDVRIGWLAVRIAGFEGWGEIHAGRRIGQIAPLSESAGGLAILAQLDCENDYLAWAQGQNGRGIKAGAVRAELGRVRSQGFARTVQPGADGAEIAFPVRAADGHALAAVCVDSQGPLLAERPDPEMLGVILAQVAELEAVLAAEPELARDAFAHLDPDELSAAIA